MPNPVKHVTFPETERDPESLEELRGLCARMAPHWATPKAAAAVVPVPPSRIHGVSVPVRSARLLDAMSEYGD
ncbi:hypothetical protein [Streptomyces sp. NPDC051162]|uniref:hypothetical protein n=1 Tax=unclassified Streptomyces TaxID=2593676 RepID=UPI0034122819